MSSALGIYGAKPYVRYAMSSRRSKQQRIIRKSWFIMEKKTIFFRFHNRGSISTWRRGSVVRTPVFGWQTSPDLCL